MKKYLTDIGLLIAFGVGVVCGYYSLLVLYIELAIFFYALFRIMFGKGPDDTYLYAGMLGGMELLIRMSEIPIFHEFTKYAIILLLGIEIIKRGRPIPLPILIYSVCLFPAIMLVDADFDWARKIVSSDLSGPVCLAVSTIYFANRSLPIWEIRKLFLCILFPLAAMIGYMWVNTPDLSQVKFTSESNFVTSIWGPNQVSSIIGMGVLLIGMAYLLKIRLFSLPVSLAFLLVLLFRGLLTFARGGMIAPLLVLVIVFVYLSWYTIKSRVAFMRIIGVTLFLTAAGYVTFQYTNKLTNDALLTRYSGSQRGESLSVEQYSSGRTFILELDWRIFLDHPIMGVGVGMGKRARAEYGYPFDVAAHNEFTRLLAEHGSFGIISLVILIGLPVVYFFKPKTVGTRAFMLCMVGFSFAFMSHSATRIAIPSLFYGLAFINVLSEVQVLQIIQLKVNALKKRYVQSSMPA